MSIVKDEKGYLEWALKQEKRENMILKEQVKR